MWMLWQTGFFFLMNALFFFYFRSRYQFYSDCFCHDHADFPLQGSGRSAFLCLLVQVDFTVSWLPALKNTEQLFFYICSQTAEMNGPSLTSVVESTLPSSSSQADLSSSFYDKMEKLGSMGSRIFSNISGKSWYSPISSPLFKYLPC